MNFEAYMNEKIPTWEKCLSLDVIASLKIKFDEVQMWQKSLDTINNNMKNHNKSGIDYSTDFEKDMDRLTRARWALESDISEINAVIKGESIPMSKEK